MLHSLYAVFCCPFFPIRDLWMWGMTPAERRDEKILSSSFLNVKWIPLSAPPGKQ